MMRNQRKLFAAALTALAALLATNPARAEQTITFTPEFQQPFTELECQVGAVPECEMSASAEPDGSVSSSTHLPGPLLLAGSYVSSGVRLTFATSTTVESFRISVALHIEEISVSHEGLSPAWAAVDLLAQVREVACCAFLAWTDLLATTSGSHSIADRDLDIILDMESDRSYGPLPPGDHEIDVVLRAYAHQGGLPAHGESSARFEGQIRSVAITLAPCASG